MGRFIRFLLRALAIVLGTAAVYLAITYRDYTGIYANTCQKRTATDIIVVHHDDVPRETSCDEVQYQHRVANGWESGFAYHFFLMGGKIYQMHQIDDATIHAYGCKLHTIAVCVHQPDKYDARTRLNLWLTILAIKIRYNLHGSGCIRGHGEMPGNPTDCPQMDMDSLRGCFKFNPFNSTKWTKETLTTSS